MATVARSCMAEGVNPPATVIPIGGVVGRIPKRLADSVHNRLNLIPAPSHSENALTHWHLNWFQWSIRKVAQASFVRTDPTLLPLHIRLHNTSRPHSFKSHSKLKTSCKCKIIDKHQVQNPTTVFKSSWKILIVKKSSQKAQRSTAWTNFAVNLTLTFWQDARLRQVGVKLPMNNNSGM